MTTLEILNRFVGPSLLGLLFVLIALRLEYLEPEEQTSKQDKES